jgi:urease beta subunit
MVLVCAPTHRLAANKSLALSELAGENMVSFDSDLTIRREIDRVLQLHHSEVRVGMEFDNIETMKRAVEIDAGVALLPEPTIRREVEAGTLVAVPLETDELVRPLGIIFRRGKELSSTTRRFMELLQNEAQLFSPGHDGAESSAHAVEPSNGAECSHSGNGNGQVHAPSERPMGQKTRARNQRAGAKDAREASLPSGSGHSARSPRPSSPRERCDSDFDQAETGSPLVTRLPVLTHALRSGTDVGLGTGRPVPQDRLATAPARER